MLENRPLLRWTLIALLALAPAARASHADAQEPGDDPPDTDEPAATDPGGDARDAADTEDAGAGEEVAGGDDAETPETPAAEESAETPAAPEPPGSRNRLIVLASPTPHGQRVENALRSLASGRGYQIATRESVVRAVQNADLSVSPSPADLWQLTRTTGADRTLFAHVTEREGQLWVQILVADATGAGPWTARGWVPATSYLPHLSAAVGTLVDQALPSPGAAVPMGAGQPPPSYRPAARTPQGPQFPRPELPEPEPPPPPDPGWGYDLRAWLGTGLMGIERPDFAPRRDPGRAGFVGAGAELRASSDGGEERFVAGGEIELRLAQIPDQGDELAGTFEHAHSVSLVRAVPTVGFDYGWIGLRAGVHLTNATGNETVAADVDSDSAGPTFLGYLAGRARFGYRRKLNVSLVLRDGPRCWRPNCRAGIMISFPTSADVIDIGITGNDGVSLWGTFPFRISEQVLFLSTSIGSTDNGPSITVGVGLSGLRADRLRSQTPDEPEGRAAR